MCKIEIFTRTENGKEYTDVKFHPDIYLKDLSNKKTKRKWARRIKKLFKNLQILKKSKTFLFLWDSAVIELVILF